MTGRTGLAKRPDAPGWSERDRDGPVGSDGPQARRPREAAGGYNPFIHDYTRPVRGASTKKPGVSRTAKRPACVWRNVS